MVKQSNWRLQGFARILVVTLRFTDTLLLKGFTHDSAHSTSDCSRYADH